MLDFINVDSSIRPESGLVRMNTASFAEIIENYSDVEACLRDTPYAWCLE
jgi:hypothetical protein